jgi:hypothetical protein
LTFTMDTAGDGYLKFVGKELDSKSDANYGWLEDLDDRDHLMLHIKGILHDYETKSKSQHQNVTKRYLKPKLTLTHVDIQILQGHSFNPAQ